MEQNKDAGMEALKSLIINTAQALWENKEALGTFLDVVRRSSAYAQLADAIDEMTVRPANASAYGVSSREFQAS